MIGEWIRRRLPELIEEHGVVGAQVAVLHNGEIVDAAAGVLDNVTNEPVTSDSIFQIGSITKVWTATLVQELVNEGLLDLNRPVRDVVPEFRLADERAASVITPRQLLCHTAGFEGDLFYDTGDGDDMLAKYLERMADTEQTTPPGELYVYCNSGYVVLGRIVEVLRGKPFNTVLRERLLDRLGLGNAATRHAEYTDRWCASGHLRGDDGMKPVTEKTPEGDSPAGSVLAMSARDLLAFVRMHLGTTEFDAMRETQVVPPDFGFGGRQGLGWVLYDYENGLSGMGHDGSTPGNQAYLRVIPACGLAVAVLTNGGAALSVVRAVHEKVLGELANVTLREPPEPPAVPVPIDVDAVVGVYRTLRADIHVTAGEHGRVRMRAALRDDEAPAVIEEYTGFRDDALIAVEQENGRHEVVVLCGRNERGKVKWLHWGRVAVRQ
ncbi:CubicO group peptidase (beta-lactamase class C family) [Lentzea atacamensis]|uniref:CubicO group peptidase (Beta-lactamase class C family) n=1 Tax=Lentzea atacamensis TaxID=531938 RepID=A0ABX9E8A2_9PSEU|nr:serine hydrolase domain-containing protein [Lentzea atacamensis]RAS64588.1 CubicO group peptidase (beta-lactamase class C family) [Lentzea atacamensis]